MRLVSAKVGPFKSINEPQTVTVEPTITVFVGMNEAGKTVFLQALEKSHDASGLAGFDSVDDYPRKDLPTYLKQHKTKPAEATVLTYQLSHGEVTELNEKLQTKVNPGFTFSVQHLYDDTERVVNLMVDEQPVIESLVVDAGLSSDARAAVNSASSVRVIPEALKDIGLTEEDKTFVKAVEARIAKSKMPSVVQWEMWEWLKPRIPKFVYFNEYKFLPSKINLADLARRVELAKSEPKQLSAEHRGVLALLRMADITIADFTKPGGFEPLKAKIEGVSINLTDQIMAFWKQNEDLEVEVVITSDLEDEAPYNNGPNLYLRIKNRRHRGVSTPFGQRSHGFIWFFSFLVWFDSVQHQLETAGKTEESDLILLLDEPGLSLHALAQDDFLFYIDTLAKKHQVLYTTHSPFMVHSDRLAQVRVVEDREKIGTVISDNVSGSDPRTIFPLQAALGWTIAQSLFISKRNLLVEGTSDMIFLDAVSTILEMQGRTGLRGDVTIVPAGGLDKVVTFIALLGANKLQLAVLHDYRGTPEQKLIEIVRQKMISPKAVLNASQFRDVGKIGVSGNATDIEDLFGPALYLDCFNRVFVKQLNGTVVSETDLPPGDRIVERIERYLNTKDIRLRPSGGFNHHTVAAYFAIHPPASLEVEVLERFEQLFSAVNDLFGEEPSVPREGMHDQSRDMQRLKQRLEPVMAQAVEGLIKEEIHEQRS
jgi:predicted ATPase